MDERLRATLACVVETFCAEAPSRAVADRIVAELEAVGRPKLLSDLALFLRVIELPLANLALAGVSQPFSVMTRSTRERYLLRWADSPLPLRRTAFQAAKRLALFVAYAHSNGGPNPLWEGIGYSRPELAEPARSLLRARVCAPGETVRADAVVVGSGAGGAVVAAELAKAGRLAFSGTASCSRRMTSRSACSPVAPSAGARS